MPIQRCPLVASLILLAGLAQSLNAGPCELEYGAVTEALRRALLPQPANRRILTTVQNAFRVYGSGTPQSENRAAAQLSAATAVLNGVTGVPAESSEAVRSAIDRLGACMAKAIPTTMVQARVSIAEEPITQLRPTGAGVTVLVDDEPAATTAVDGTASVTVAIGQHDLSARVFPDLWGHVQSGELKAGTNQSVNIVMHPGADLAIPADLNILEAPGDVLSKNLKSVTLQLLDEHGAPIRLRSLDMLNIISGESADGTGAANVAHYYAVRGDGTVSLTNSHGFAAAFLKWPDPVTIRLRARDAKGVAYRGAAQFSVGRYTSTAHIVPPPGVTIDRGSIFVGLTHQPTQLSFWSRTSAAGFADFPQLPRGYYLVTCDVVQGKTRYFGRTGFTLDTDGKRFDIPLFAVGTQGKNSVKVVATTGSRSPQSVVRLPEPPPCYVDQEGNCHPTPSAPRQEPVTEITFEISAHGTIRPTHIGHFNTQHHLKSATEEELVAVRRHDDAFRRRSGKGFVEVRAYDIHNDVVFRALEYATLYRGIESARSARKEPLLNWIPVKPPWSFRVTLPREGVQRVEVRGWLPHSEATFDMDVLALDPKLLALPQ